MTDEAFELAIGFVLPHETEFVRGHWGDYGREGFVRTENVAGDHGGVTRYGIDQASHPRIDVAHLTHAGAVDIYREEWERDQLDLLPEKLAVAAFDVHVNGGNAGLMLQRAYNATHTQWPALTEDGQLGPISISALNSVDAAGIRSIVHTFLLQRDARFRRLAQNPSQAKFLDGWLQRDRDLELYLLAPASAA